VTVHVRMYNVGFGDCFLVTLPDPRGERDRTILIDCGRHVGTLGDDPPFWDVVDQLVADLPTLDGTKFIDVLVITHRHRDHVHGFSRAATWEDVRVGEVWMPWTENPSDSIANGLRQQQDRVAALALHGLLALGSGAADPSVSIALNSLTNQAAMTTIDAFDAPTQYLPDPLRPASTVLTSGGATGLPEGVRVHVLGPSRDPAVIRRLNPPSGQAYLRLVPAERRAPILSLDGPDGPELPDPPATPILWGGAWDLDRAQFEALALTPRADLKPPYKSKDLEAVSRSALAGASDLAVSVDDALNGTSLVLLFEIGETLLLFPGDAQWGTWEAILNDDAWVALLDRVAFYKVGHHGSHNATPVEFVEQHLHAGVAMVSVSKTVYDTKGWKQIPKTELLDAMRGHGVALLLRSDDDPAVPPGDPRVTRKDNVWTEVALG